MKNHLLEELKEHLASTSKEQFQQQWAEIEQMGFEGPSVEEFLDSTSMKIEVQEIKFPATTSSLLPEFPDQSPYSSNLAAAA